MLLQLQLHVLAQLQVQSAQGLVQQQHLGPVHQGPGDGHPLLLAAGEGVRLAVFKALQADDLQHLHDPLPDLLLRELDLRRLPVGSVRVRPLLHPQAEGHVFKHVQVGEQGVLLEHRVDLPPIGRNVINPHTVEQDVSRHRGREAADNTQRCGLAAAAGSKQCEEFFVVDIEV